MAFVSSAPDSQHAAHGFTYLERTVMCIERIIRNLSFGLAALVIVLSVGLIIEYQPVINALAR
jgi:hypothetical protein